MFPSRWIRWIHLWKCLQSAPHFSWYFQFGEDCGVIWNLENNTGNGNANQCSTVWLGTATSANGKAPREMLGQRSFVFLQWPDWKLKGTEYLQSGSQGSGIICSRKSSQLSLFSLESLLKKYFNQRAIPDFNWVLTVLNCFLPPHWRWLNSYHGLGEYSSVIGWRVSINFWYMDTYGTPQVVPVKQSVQCGCVCVCVWVSMWIHHNKTDEHVEQVSPIKSLLPSCG